MTRWFEKQLESYLRGAGSLEAAVLGEPARQRMPSQEQNEEFVMNLGQSFHLRNSLVILIALMYLALFAAGLWLVFVLRGNPGVIPAVLGGNVLSLAAIMYWLTRLWRDKTYLDVVTDVVRGLPPREAVRVLQTLFYGSRRGAPAERGVGFVRAKAGR